MTRLKILPALAFLSCFGMTGFCQTASTIDSLKKINQTCLDSGWHMSSCEYNYFLQLDSILNVVYHKLQLILSPSDIETLKKEQIHWLKQRDIVYNKSYKEYLDSLRSREWGTDMEEIAIGDKTDFTEKRVLELIGRLNK
jgi:uncharacterized protein YecT (DUF1311 family)